MQEKTKNCYRDDLPEFLRELRTKAGLSQNDVADILGKTRTDYAYYESGKLYPGIESLITLCGLYKIKLSQFMNSALSSVFTVSYEGLGQLSTQELQLIYLVRQFDPENCMLLHNLINIADEAYTYCKNNPQKAGKQLQKKEPLH